MSRSRLPFRVSGSVVYPDAPDRTKKPSFADQLDAEVAGLIEGLPDWMQAELLRGWLSAHGVTV